MFILRRKRKVEVATETALLPQLLWRRVSHLELLRRHMDFMKATYLARGVLAQYTKIEGAFKSFDSECDVLSNIVTEILSKSSVMLHPGHGPNHVVHCDVKSSNILLDDDMVAHVADFGIARLLGEGDSMTQTMTLATIGYMGPEFRMEGIISTRGDMYSFGIVPMETFTRRKPTDEIWFLPVH
ncbi:hypothetical protein Pyn_15833 [Prunus yedoensis var. nudiflora]|uniref:Protein kinase domain-containing protein n=1 Tax=Prunus yedoensis var. nudiflora TaxID=2094558 RepID=A0A314XYG5_PRUYE|nr:hypothetical protein Pyn_15833 [Prunus yedoensis var. nudiflora]